VPGAISASPRVRPGHRPASQGERDKVNDDWFESGSGGTLDVGALLDSKAGELLNEIVASGALLSLGLTSDSGALGVTVTVDGRWRREYFRSADDLSAWIIGGLPDIRDAVALARAARASSAPRKGRRGL
jgi:hypothetical protein